MAADTGRRVLSFRPHGVSDILTSLPLRAPADGLDRPAPKRRALSTIETRAWLPGAGKPVRSYLTGRGVSRAEAAHLHNWQTDPFARWRYSYIAPAGRRARSALAAPLEDTLFFAGRGEPTHRDEAADSYRRAPERRSRRTRILERFQMS